MLVTTRVIVLFLFRLNAFLEGFYDIIPMRLISIFNEQELELLISGLPNVDIEDLRTNTEYHKYQANSLQVCFFVIVKLICTYGNFLFVDSVVLESITFLRSSRSCQVPPVCDGYFQSPIARIRGFGRHEWRTEVPNS